MRRLGGRASTKECNGVVGVKEGVSAFENDPTEP